MAETEQEGAYVPLEVYLSLSGDDLKHVWNMLFGMAKRYAREEGIPLHAAQLEKVVEVSIRYVQRLKSCSYLAGPNGRGTIIALASVKIPFACEDEKRKFKRMKAAGHFAPHQSFNPDWDEHQKAFEDHRSSDVLGDGKSWFKDAIAGHLESIPKNHVEDLVAIVELIFDSKETLFSFENRLTLHAGSIGKILGISENRVAKLGAHLRRLLELHAGDDQ